MNNLSEKIEDLKERIIKAKEWLDFDKKREKIIELESLVSRPDFWDNPTEASKISQELADLKEDIDTWEEYEKEVNDLSDLLSQSEEGSDILEEIESQVEVLENRLAKSELKFFLSGKYDKNDAIVTISAGQGGHDAEDFVRMLFNMYVGYFDKQGWKVEILSRHYSEESGGSNEAKGERGLRNISFEVSASYAFGYLKNETGVHRLVRVSPFDAKKLRHTSFALVDVMPDLEEIEMNEIELEEKDLKIDFTRSSGPGGQNVNKRETAVRIVHLPTGLSAACQSERSQIQNRDRALHLLKAKLFNYLKNKAKEDLGALKKRIEPSWGNQIRNYVLHPYKLVKDVRTDVEKNDVESVLEGDIEDFIQAELKI